MKLKATILNVILFMCLYLSNLVGDVYEGAIGPYLLVLAFFTVVSVTKDMTC